MTVVKDPKIYDIDLLAPNSLGWFKDDTRIMVGKWLEGSPKVIVEIGAWLGQSSTWIASSMPADCHLYCVDTWEGSFEHKTQEQWQGYLPTLYQQFLSNVVHKELQDRITPIKMTSVEAAKIFDLPIDILVIDGSHDYPDPLLDLQSWYPKLAKGGLVGGDDYVWPGVAQSVQEFASQTGLDIMLNGEFWYFGAKP